METEETKGNLGGEWCLGSLVESCGRPGACGEGKLEVVSLEKFSKDKNRDHPQAKRESSAPNREWENIRSGLRTGRTATSLEAD